LLNIRRFSESFAPMFAHIAGIPVEESLPWLVPISGLGVAGIIAWARAKARSVRQRLLAPVPGDGKRRGS
jgi:hypothetical protein